MQVENNEVKEASTEFPWRIKLGALAGLPLYIHLTFFLWFFLLFWVDKTQLVLIVSLFILSIGLHELAHALVCRFLGLGSGSLTIWLFGGYFIPFSETAIFEMNRKQRIQYVFMILAGPAINFILWLFFISLAYATSMRLFYVAANFNLGLALLNLLPAGRLDGGNILIYLGSNLISWRKAMIAAGVLALVAAVVSIVGMFTDSWISRYSNWSGFLLGMGISSIKMSGRSEEEIKEEGVKTVRKEIAFVTRTNHQSRLGRILSLSLIVGLLGMLLFSIGYVGSQYLTYHNLPGRIVYGDADKGVNSLHMMKGMGFPNIKISGTPMEYPFHLSASADGARFAYYCASSLNEDLTSMCVDDAAGKLIAKILFVESIYFMPPLLSPLGDKIAIESIDEGSLIFDVATGLKKQIPQGSGMAAWSPNGQYILLAYVQKEGQSDILRMNTDGSEIQNLTNFHGHDYSPVYSTDGKNIYFVSDRDGENALYKMDADGANITKIKLTNPIYVDDYPAIKISPDNSRVAFECGESGGVICTAMLDGSDEKQVAQGEWPVWSPDGQYIAYMSTWKTKGIFVVTLNDDPPYLLAPLDDWNNYFVWLP